MHSVLGVAAVLGEFAAMMAGLRAWQRLGSPRPETTRKALHIGMRAVATALPWVFAPPRPVVALCALVAVAMWVARRLPALRGVLCGVERESWGDLYFPVAVAVTFVAARGNKLLYAVPMLTLTLADATAALIRLRFGTHRYRATEGRKSAEGSLAFFVTAFASSFAPVWLAQAESAKALLIGAILGLLVMALEAIAWRRLDNLFVPLDTFVWLFLAAVTGHRELLFPFTLAFACHLAIIGSARLCFDFPRLATPALLATCVVKSWAVIVLPFALIAGRWAWWPAGLAVVLIAAACVAFHFTQPGMEDCPTDAPRWIGHALLAGAASALGVFVL